MVEKYENNSSNLNHSVTIIYQAAMDTKKPPETISVNMTGG